MLIGEQKIKPNINMKIVSGKIKSALVIALVVSVVALFTIRVFAQGSTPRPTPADKRLTLKLKDAELKDDTGDSFKKAMKAVKGNQYSLRVKYKDGKQEEIVPPPDGASIRTDKVISSEMAKNSDTEFTAIGVHVTQTIVSDSAAEIDQVLQSLK